ncbi:protein RRP6-like 3 isoform X3 [Mangifera indica]|uniref:protein RRP6-like 3 isoform X3 n=1 Tax=Mangifera indica TaxID=29780 RepID=UPI001CFC4638|nr:protein RRP6-like 3 isoform X3 [Mangifera indica]
MDHKDKIKIAVTVASLAVISIFFTTQYRRRRKLKCPPSSCYLQTEPKPQHNFKRVLADNSYSPFKHAKNEKSSGGHPYEAEITALLEKPPPEFKFVTDDLKLNESFVWVRSKLQLEELAITLSRETVFAVDTEQHSLRSFLGFTALIQISTEKEDYLIDTMALHDEMSILHPVFSDPGICKVFHGADNDVLWLQRDFCLYVVNLFDTAKREDWRQRPLPPEMLQYAQTDAHYLLYIAKCLIDELKQQETENSSRPNDKFNFVLEASRRSNMVCLQLYTKEFESYPGEAVASAILYRQLNGQGDVSSISCKTQFQELVRRLCTWRDLMARVHDESLRFVLSEQAIVALADKVPATATDICFTIAQADLDVDSVNFNSCLPSPSPVVCSHLGDLHNLIQDKLGNLDDIFQAILHKCLGPNGSCPLSVFNYTILAKCNLKLIPQRNRLVYKQNGWVKNSKQFARKASRELFVQKFSCKAPVYHNCRIYANDGRLLCYCDRRKLDWYIHRNLAKLVDDDPPAIMLLFEPKGRPEDEGNDFYIQSKKNICVGCGEGNHYLRYRIIPSCYRMHFPEHLKSHRSHDIVLLCVDCHEVAHAAAEKYKKQIAAEFGIPLFIHKVVDLKQAQDRPSSSMKTEETGVSPLQLRTAAMALLRHGPRMPTVRREELRQIVMRYYGGREISEEDLERALLVGMSPRERRRLGKKRGVYLKHSTCVDVSKEEHNNFSGGTEKSATVGATEANNLDGLLATETEPFGEKEIHHFATVMDDDISNTGFDQVTSSTNNKNRNSIGSEVSDTKDDYDGNDDDVYENRSVTNGTVDLLYPTYDGSGSPKHNSKLSLLGHGPHGKQVVDYLLQEYGDDGIRQFCQRWRQVFVEAIHPSFLPAGWDVQHSGRREFGEFSVYNPAKKTVAAASMS